MKTSGDANDTTFEQDGLVIRVSQLANQATIHWNGQSDSRNPGSFLNPLISQLVNQLRGREVTIDFRKLDYMNSSTVSPMLNFIRSFNAAGIPTRVVYDANVDWQRINFLCMKTIAKTLKYVRIESP